jgi:hypothetical protein
MITMQKRKKRRRMKSMMKRMGILLLDQVMMERQMHLAILI